MFAEYGLRSKPAIKKLEITYNWKINKNENNEKLENN